MARSKNPRPKTEADRRYNERRRIKRAAERLAKQAKLQTGKIKQETLKHVNNLKQAVKDSYYNRQSKQYQQTITQLQTRTRSGREYERKIAEQTRERSFAENQRITKMQENYFRSASKTMAEKMDETGPTAQQRLVRMEQSFFYSKTRVLWLGGSESMRNENIVAGLRGIRLASGRTIQNLQDAVEWVKEQFPDEYPTLERVMKGVYDTDNDTFFQDEEEAEDASPSPISRAEFRALGVSF